MSGKEFLLANGIVVMLSAVALGEGIKGLVLHYSFDEGSGNAVADKSGNGNDGRVCGASFVKRRKGFALKFDGVDDYVDCGNRPTLDISKEGISVAAWVYVEDFPAFGSAGVIGKRTDIYLLRANQYGHCGWSVGKDTNTAEVTSEGPYWKSGEWHHFVGTYDGQVVRAYVDGRLTGEKQIGTVSTSKGATFWLGRTGQERDWISKNRFQGSLDDVRVYNRGLTADEVQRLYAATSGKPVSLEITPAPHIGKIFVRADLRSLGEALQGAKANLVIERGKREIKKVRVGTLRGPDLKLTVEGNDLPPGDYAARLLVRSKSGRTTASASFTWPRVTRFPAGGRLNNLVTELLNVKGRTGRKFTFSNPRDGWVFVSVRAGGEIGVSIDGQALSLVAAADGALEAMGELSAGRHELTLSKPVGRLIVRAVPALIYAKFGRGPAIAEFGRYDWNLMGKYVFGSLNVIVGQRSAERLHNLDECLEWKRLGRKWLVEDYARQAAKDPQWWINSPGLRDPADGIIVDEFSGRDAPEYSTWTASVHAIGKDPKFRTKVFVPYSNKLYEAEASSEFLRAALGYGWSFATERYLQEQPSEEEAWYFIAKELRCDAIAYGRKFPGSTAKMIVCFGTFSVPGMETLDLYPTCSYKVYLDMQMNLVASDPAFDGARGLMMYTSSSTSEETFRWVMRLFRHYGIEGKTSLLSDDPYELPHLENPGFASGLQGWQVRPAEQGRIESGQWVGLGWLEGLYPKTPGVGDAVLITRRSAKGSNRFSQTIKALRRGRLYSLSMFVADHDDMSGGKEYAVKVALEGADVVERQMIPIRSTKDAGPYGRDNPASLNYHRILFRPKGTTAKLIVSDWADDSTPGGPIGQRLMFNFIQVQPYLEP